VGKLEKVIVLTVLFLVAAILGVSLNSESGVAEASSTPVTKTQPSTAGDLARAGGLPQAEKPAGTRRRRGAQAPLSAEEAPVSTSTSNSAPDSRLLNSTVPARQEPAQATPEPVRTATTRPEPTPVAVPEPTRTLEGLVPTAHEGLMIYTWRKGDTYATVATTYLGAGQTNTLRKANEDRREESLRAGDQILIPTDGEQTASSSVYTVVAGDVLGTISTKVYGTSKKWQQIFDANRDVLESANSLKVGQVLRIPAQQE